MIQKHVLPIFLCLSASGLTGCFDVVDKVEPATATESPPASPPVSSDQGNQPEVVSPPPAGDQPAADQDTSPASGDEDPPAPVADENDPPASGNDNPPPPVEDENDPPAGGNDNPPPPVEDENDPPAGGNDDPPPPVEDENDPPADGNDDPPPPVEDENDPATNSAPTIFGSPTTSTTVGDTWSFRPGTADPDGDALTFRIDNQPVWSSFNTMTGSLSGIPQNGQDGDYTNIRITVNDGLLSTALPTFTVTVLVVETNSAPTISGSPPTTTTAGEQYGFVPNADDADGDTLTFSIANAPPWTSFDTNSGRLTGSAADSDVGNYGDIVISVSDGELTSALPGFEIAVSVADVNEAPDISGSPFLTITARQAYSFQPDASDPDGDSLSFSISDLPSWASFDSDSGLLSGTPSDVDAGVYESIQVSVSDGELTASLAAFSITVTQSATGSATLTWTPPTANTDGSPLTDLTGYKIYYGTSRGNYPNEIMVDNPGLATYVIENLSANTYFFVTKSVNSQQIESEFSNEASKTIN